MQRETFKKKAERIPSWSKFLSFFLISLNVFTKQSYCNSSKQEKTARGCDSFSEVNGEALLVIMEYLKRLYPCKSQKTKFRVYTNWTELDFLGKCQQVWEKFFSWFILLLIFSFSSLIKTLELLFGILQFKFMWFLYICFFFALDRIFVTLLREVQK